MLECSNEAVVAGFGVDGGDHGDEEEEIQIVEEDVDEEEEEDDEEVESQEKMPSFEEAFEDFVQANTCKGIRKSFEVMCVRVLKLNLKLIFEEGTSLAQIYSSCQQQHTQSQSRGSSFQFRMQQRQQLAQLSKQAPTRLVYQIIKAHIETNFNGSDGTMINTKNNNNKENAINNTNKNRYWKANDLWKRLDKRLSHKDYSRDTTSKDKYEKNETTPHVLIIGAGPVGKYHFFITLFI